MDIQVLKEKFTGLASSLNERTRRLWGATEARALGHGGIALVERATGISRSTIVRGMCELKTKTSADLDRVRKAGGGRKPSVKKDRTLMKDLESLVEPTASGHPQSALQWTSKATRRLAKELQAMGHTVSHRLVWNLLYRAGFSLQANRKAREGTSHPDRDAQFHYIHRQVQRCQKSGEPVISVDTKKKELVGDFKNPGRQWRPKGEPQRVRVHDFLMPTKGKAIPYGVYDLTQNAGWVNLGIDHDTARFAVRSIRRWWQIMGRTRYPRAASLLITADSGGSNGARNRLWKWALQQFADKTGLSITVCHFPPGTSKWNKIEHRLFSYISMNWKGRPLVSLAVIVSLIAATQTESGLRIRCELDKGQYPKGEKITEVQMNAINIHRHRFHGDWNYTIHPSKHK